MSVLAAIHANAKAAGLDEDARRDVYLRVTGKTSAKAMTEDERRAVADELRRLHPALEASSRRPDGRPKLTGKYAAKLQALWIAGWNLGIVRNRDDAALEAFVKRQTGLDAVRFCHDAGDAFRAIEALKKWLARDGGVDWSQKSFWPAWTQTNGYRIAEAQFRSLKASGAVTDDLVVWCLDNGLPQPALMNDRDWIAVMNRLGTLIRERQP